MQLFDPNNPNEKKKMIAAAALGLAAIIVLGYVFLGGSSKKPANRRVATATPTPARVATTQPPSEMVTDDVSTFQPIVYNNTVPAASEADRNVLAYYVQPQPPGKQLPTQKPTPPPP